MVLFIIMKAESKGLEKGWSDICLKYRQWEDLLVKGRMRMKKKINKDGKQYYDFDFSRYQYYYSYPEDHIGLASPTTQRQFINYIMDKSTENFSPQYLDCDSSNWDQIQKILKPVQLHNFLKDMNQELNQRMSSLRLQKTLRIKKMKGLFGNQNQIQKTAVQFIQSQIKSLTHKQIKISNRFCLLGDPLQERLKSRKSNLKTRGFDQLQFTDLSKGDFVVLMRVRQVKHTLSFNSHVLKSIITQKFKQQYSKFKSRVFEKRAEKTQKKKNIMEANNLKISENLTQRLIDNDPNHFDKIQNKYQLQRLMQSLDYIKCFQSNVQQTQAQKFYSPAFTTILLNYDQAVYVPFNHSEVKQRLVGKIKYYFNKNLIDEEVVVSSDEHICYKINNLCFLQLKVVWETYNNAHKKQEGTLLKIRSMMRKQLQLVFSRHIVNLLNIRQHSIKIAVGEKWIPKLLFDYRPQTQKQSIMDYQLKQQKRFRDPMICSFVELLGVNRDVVVRQQIQKYVDKSIKVSSQLYQYKALYYKNCSGDEKTHLINVLNNYLAINQDQSQMVLKEYFKIIHAKHPSENTDPNFLKSYYMLVFLRCTQMHYQLLQRFNAQLMCVIKAQSRIRMLWKKSKIPFEMSKQFVTRFTDPSESNADPYDFLNPDAHDSHVDQIFKQMYNEDADKDYIDWKSDVGVEVRRRRSDNPLLQGKSIMYGQSKQLLEQCLKRIQFLSSQTIKKRQIFLPNAQLSQVVDRLQLLFQFLNKELDFQQAKLKIMDSYHQLLLRSTSAQGIQITYEQLMKLINYNNVVDLTQPHYSQCYDCEISCMNSKAAILKLLIEKQCKLEKEYIARTAIQFKQANFGANLPELASMYYTEEITIQEREIIEEDLEDQTQSILSDSESEIQNTIKGQTISEMSSSMLEAGSHHFHLKTSFQQVLSKNSVQGIKQQNNKKDQVMNRKKQRTINDSILGALLPRNTGQKTNIQFYTYSYFAVQTMRSIDFILQNHYLYPKLQIKSMFLQELVSLIQQYKYEQFKPLLKPQQLTISLNVAHKTLNKFLQKVKIQGNISSRSSNEHWLMINSKIMQKIISGESGQQVDQMRGLYICLNAFQINQINFRVKQIDRIQKSQLGQFKDIMSLLNQFSTGQSVEKGSELQGISYFERRSLCLYKMYSLIKEAGQLACLCSGNYYLYYKAICAYDLATHNLLNAFSKMLHSQLGDFNTLQSQLKMMQMYGCCTNMFSHLSSIPGIENRVYLRKKLDFMTSYRRTFFPKQSIAQLSDVLENCSRLIPKFRKVEAKMSLSSTANSAYQFELYVNQIMKSSILINMVAEQLKCQIRSHRQIFKLNDISNMLPLIDKYLSVNPLHNHVILTVFGQHRDKILKLEKKPAKTVKFMISQQKLSINRILDSIVNAADIALNWTRDECLVRKKQELKGDARKLQFQKYLSRHFTQSYAESQIQLKLNFHLREKNKFYNLLKLRQWMQSQLLIFGCNLKQNQLIKLRKMLNNPQIIFPIFWQDNTKHIIGTRQLSKMRSTSLDAEELIKHYKEEYLTELHLKKIYRSFVQDLSEFEFQQQTSDLFLVLYSGASSYFKDEKHQWNFLSRFCDPFASDVITQVDSFCNFIKSTMCSSATIKQTLFQLNRKQKHYSLDALKFGLWNSQNKNKVKLVDSTRRFLKQRLNQSKSLAIKNITDEIIMPYFRMQRFVQALQFLNISQSDYKIAIEDYRSNFEKYVHEGYAILNSKQYYIFNLSQKNAQSRGQLIKSKEQVMKIIAVNQFYLKLIREKFFEFCGRIVDRELSMRKILQEDMKNQENSRDKMILKQTLNKILVPKVKLNPFLSSPLKIQNYFFAGTIKMSYIDQFLNKLRNRAVLIQLAEGGTGYLLKVNQLDQSVEVLCKSIVGFSEKQFADRFRTLFQAFQDTKQRNLKLQQQNKNLKAIINAVKGYQSKQIKSLLYQKLNDYLVPFYEHQKDYNIILNLLKSIQNKMQCELNKKYSTKINQLQFDNKKLKQEMQKIRNQFAKTVKSNIHQIKDDLYGQFKHRAEDVLNKQFIKQIDQSLTFQAMENHDSQILTKKLKMQKHFYQLKLSKMQSTFNEKVASLQKKLFQQSKLQNLLLMEQQKNKCLLKQVKQLQKCSIQNELLKKQISKKQQEQTMQKFRLVKVNQSLKGKMKRMQEEHEEEKTNINSKFEHLIKSQNKNVSSYSVQVSNSEQTKIKRKSFHIKTQYSSTTGPNLYEIGIWKQKWMRSEKKLQQIIENLKKVYEHFSFTKNSMKLTQNLKKLIADYQNRKIEVSSIPIQNY